MLGLNSIAGGVGGGSGYPSPSKSIRELADDFNKRSGALMINSRETLGDISRAVNNIDRNPTRPVRRRNSTPAEPGAAPARPAAPPPRTAGEKKKP